MSPFNYLTYNIFFKTQDWFSFTTFRPRYQVNKRTPHKITRQKQA